MQLWDSFLREKKIEPKRGDSELHHAKKPSERRHLIERAECTAVEESEKSLGGIW